MHKNAEKKFSVYEWERFQPGFFAQQRLTIVVRAFFMERRPLTRNYQTKLADN